MRFLMLLSLVVWIGGVVLFALLAPTAFQVLPTRHLAGNIVGAMLGKLHWMGLISGIVFLISSLLHSRIADGSANPFALRNGLIIVMLALTLVSQFVIIPRMDVLRASLGDVSAAPADNSQRLEFDSLHAWSTRLEVTVLLLGLVVIGSVARRF